MFKKVISLFTIISFLFSVTSCSYRFKKIKIEKVIKIAKEQKKKVEIIELEMKSGKRYGFSITNPAYLTEDGVEVRSLHYEKIELDKSDVKESIKNKKGISFIVKNDGTTIEYSSLKVQNDKIILTIPKATLIPFSEISWVMLKRFDTRKATWATIWAIGTIASMILIAAAFSDVMDPR